MLDRISNVLHESSAIALLDGDETLHVVRSSTTQRITSADPEIGTRLPAYCTSIAELERRFPPEFLAAARELGVALLA
jgi:IclR family pca regulon transcriptional regulator